MPVRVPFSKSTVFEICRQKMGRFRVNDRPIRHIFQRFQNVPASCERSLRLKETSSTDIQMFRLCMVFSRNHFFPIVDFLTCNFIGYSYTSGLMWTSLGFGVNGDRGPDQRVPNLGPTVQEVISGSYWNGTGPIIIKISDFAQGSKTMYAHELDPSKAAALTIQYMECTFFVY